MVKELTTTTTDRVGVFGGTFDPIHLGHIASAQAAAQYLNLTKILIIPAHLPPHKNCVNSSPTATAEQRFAMVELACQENKLFECDNRELQRQQHSYTVDTLIELKKESPEQQLYFIIGMDSLLTFTTWHQYEKILTLCHLVVNTRPNYELKQMNAATKVLLNKHLKPNKSELDKIKVGGIIFTEPMTYDISSTQIRHNLHYKKSCHSQLSLNVINFISKNQLYR